MYPHRIPTVSGVVVGAAVGVALLDLYAGVLPGHADEGVADYPDLRVLHTADAQVDGVVAVVDGLLGASDIVEGAPLHGHLLSVGDVHPLALEVLHGAVLDCEVELAHGGRFHILASLILGVDAYARVLVLDGVSVTVEEMPSTLTVRVFESPSSRVASIFRKACR